MLVLIVENHGVPRDEYRNTDQPKSQLDQEEVRNQELEEVSKCQATSHWKQDLLGQPPNR